MGVFQERGFEYRIYLKGLSKFKNYNIIRKKDDSYIVVLGQQQTDERLLKSDYYLNRKDCWFNCKTFAEKVPGNVIVLTDDEQTLIRNILAEINEDNLKDYGLYDVGSLATSY